MSSVYRCSRVAFSKGDKCSCRSMVPSYSTMAGVRQFMGCSSAITPSVKGMPARSSARAPITRYLNILQSLSEILQSG
ncbi:UNVERIFIED_CONTAM: hypothetical protein Sangu_1327300 [Sesamum angustifolium]|uniref:Uncharacterized protein n=1 Tax=Sesamum angustifolium TaxID=2727405 RepID=A0AAW2NLP1_9LAMI